MPFTVAWIHNLEIHELGAHAQRPAVSTRSSTDHLLTRLKRYCATEAIELNLIELADLDIEAISYADRIVFSSHTRSDYPLAQIEQLTEAELGIPWGVVTGPWHSGSRRSGLGVTVHWSQPWYRWWESWHGWFFPERARAGAVCESQFSPITVPADLAMISNPRGQAINKTGLQLSLYGACKLTLDTWQQMARWAGCEVNRYAAMEGTCSDQAEPDFVLWDDSLLTCLPQRDATVQARQDLTKLNQRFPVARVLVGLSLSYLDLWPELVDAGACEVFIKPSYGLPLVDYLYSQSVTR